MIGNGKHGKKYEENIISEIINEENREVSFPEASDTRKLHHSRSLEGESE